MGEGSGGNQGSFSYYSEELYKTKKGNYFLAGEGGPMTHYARSTGQNSWTGGSHITPLTEEEAFDWAEGHLSASEVEDLFPELLEEA